MDAIIGRYRVHMEDTGLILRHMSGINFDMTPDEALGLLNFLSAYRENLTSFTERETVPLPRAILRDHDGENLTSFTEHETDHNLKRIATEKAEQEDEQP